jgi:DNA-binding CsgD family transcriptional regulator/tetratricopeptide (TPR) repeat protein
MMGDVPLDLPPLRPLIGRTDELAELARLLGVTDGPTSGVVLLSGDAGVGKTRLLHELREQARDAGWYVLVGHCLDLGDSALPYLPFGEAFGALEADSPALADEIASTQPPVTRLMPGRRAPSVAGGPVDGARADRTELFEAVYAALGRLGDDAPLLLVIEDLHWADRSTRELLSLLFARPFGSPVSIVASYRSDDLHRRHPLRAVVAEWARLPRVSRLHLAPLADADVRTLVRSLHPAPLRESDVRTVVNRAEGNAFFAEELVAAAELGSGPLPSDLSTLLLVRLDQLDEPARRLVRAASVAGRFVAHDLLSAVAGLADGELDLAVRSAVESNVLVPVGNDDAYAFRHALLAEAVYNDLLPGERVRLHAGYVEALSRADRGPGSAADIARHARAAHDLPTALRMSIRAGDDAMSVAGPDEAARHYEVALELLAESDAARIADDDVDVVGLAVKAATAAADAGRPYRAIAIVEEQLRQSGPGDPLGRARLLLALATAALLSDSNVDALAATTEALHLVPAEPVSVLRASIVSAHARANADRQRDDDAIRWAGEALQLARDLDLPDIAVDATTTLARLEERSGDPESSRRTFERIVAEAREVGDGAAELRALHHLGSLDYEQGRLREALRTYLEGAERAQSLGRPWAPYGLDARVLAALVAYQSGDWDEAQKIVDVTGQSPPAIAEAALAAVGMAVAAGRGDVGALDLMPHIRRWWHRDGMIAIISGAAAIDLHGDADDLEAARAMHDDVVAAVSHLWETCYPQARIRLSGLMLGQLCARVSRSSAGERAALAREAADLVDAADRAAAGSSGRLKRRGPESLAWMARVRAEHLRLRWLTAVDAPEETELIASWRECVAAFERFGHVFELARSQVRLATVLRAAGMSAEARPLVEASRTTARRLGAQALIAELRSLGATGPASRDRSPQADQELTPRETEILALVAQGRSNREISGQLYISAKTVSVHISNILAKLGAAGRTEAAAVARRRGLLVD